jgi:hypothetical protein
MTKGIPKLTVLLVMACVALCSTQSFAQKGKKKKKEEEKIPVYNYVIDDPMDVFGRQPPESVETTTVMLPQFFSLDVRRSGDTSFTYEGFDAANNPLKADTLSDYSRLRYVSLIQRYTDPGHTYRDSTGKLKPLPTEKIVYRYDKTGNDKWFTVNYATNKSEMLQEFPSDIVRTDTIVVVDPVTTRYHTRLYRYYRVAPMKK